MGGQENLNAELLQSNEDLYNSFHEAGVEISFGFIPKKNRTFKEHAILNKEPKEGQFSQPLGHKGEFQFSLSIF